jgi:Ferritin-like domain
MNRRRFLFTALGAGTVAVGAPWLGAAAAANDEEIAFANFAISVELLLKDYYAKALDARVVTGAGVAVLRSGRVAATRHARELAAVLNGAGDAPPVEEDFTFAWPASTFRSARAVTATGLGVLRALLGAYQAAAATVTEPSYRVLYASLAASTGQQIGALSALAGRSGAEPFPVAMDLETASAALERYLG